MSVTVVLDELFMQLYMQESITDISKVKMVNLCTYIQGSVIYWHSPFPRASTSYVLSWLYNDMYLNIYPMHPIN